MAISIGGPMSCQYGTNVWDLAGQNIISDFHKNLSQVGKCNCNTMVDFEKYLKALDLKNKQIQMDYNVPHTHAIFWTTKFNFFGGCQISFKIKSNMCEREVWWILEIGVLSPDKTISKCIIVQQFPKFTKIHVHTYLI